jgi:hypothetical protein
MELTSTITCPACQTHTTETIEVNVYRYPHTPGM